MSRRRRKSASTEPSLVPLADMLTNTVGIMLFILAFTLLATSGASALKRLPMEQATDAKPLYLLCLADRVLPLDFKVTDRLPQAPAGHMDLDEAHAFIRRGDGAEVENEYFRVRQSVRIVFQDGSPDHLLANAEFLPKDGVGIFTNQLLQTSNQFADLLKTNSPRERFLYFFVTPDGMGLFGKVRDFGAAHGYRSGWGPLGPKDHVVVGLVGRGGGNRAIPE
jgi:hypothetical protein